MITPTKSNMMRVTVTLDPEDVDLLDRLAVLEGQNRSYELRTLLEQLRPTLWATVLAFEAAKKQRDELDQAAAKATLSQLQAMQPEAERMQTAYLGAMAKLEGLMTATEGDDPAPASNTGATDD